MFYYYYYYCFDTHNSKNKEHRYKKISTEETLQTQQEIIKRNLIPVVFHSQP